MENDKEQFVELTDLSKQTTSTKSALNNTDTGLDITTGQVNDNVNNIENLQNEDVRLESKIYTAQRGVNRLVKNIFIDMFGYDSVTAWKIANTMAVNPTDEKWAKARKNAPNYLKGQVETNTGQIYTNSVNIDSLIYHIQLKKKAQRLHSNSAMDEFAAPVTVPKTTATPAQVDTTN